MFPRIVLGIILVLTFSFLVKGQYLKSPCPGTFDYKTDGRGVYGLITLLLNGGKPVTTIHLRANFTVAARLPSSYVGHIGSVDSDLLGFNLGLPLKYRVDFPETSVLPRLTAIMANDDVVCVGPPDIPGPHYYVTMISLENTLFLKGQRPGSNQHKPPQQTTQQKPDLGFFGDIPQDAQVFVLNEDGNIVQWDNANDSMKPSHRPETTSPMEMVTMLPPKPSTPDMATQPPTPLRPQNPRPSAPDPPIRQQDIVTSITTSVQCGVVAGGNEHQPLIFNGQSYSRGEWPWVVAIYKRKDGSLSFICSGTLVSDRHVVTAAHCMQVKRSITSKKDIVIKVGVYNLEDWGDDITVTRTISKASIYEQYNSTTLAHDILVLTLERNVEFNANIRPACLWSANPDQSRIVGASGVVAGWGESERGPEGQGEPRIARIPVVSTAACRASRPDFHKLTSEYTLCAGDRNGIGPCLGDSGGGFYMLEGGRWQLRGVVSLSLRPDNGDSTCNLDEYIVFTDAAKYIDWIRSIIGR